MTRPRLLPRPTRPPATQRLRRLLRRLGLTLLGILIVVLLFGVIPISPPGMQSVASPAAAYGEALVRFEQIVSRESAMVNELGHSRLLTHGNRTPRAYVLVHGTTNSPEQWQELGEMLYERGHNVLILRMPYHGLASHSVTELKALTPADLRDYADRAIDIGAGLGDELVAVGISGGGAVASWMAQHRPEVDRALLLVPFFGMHVVPNFLTPLFMNAFSRLPNIVLDVPLEPRQGWVYRGEATRGVAAFLAISLDVLQAAAAGIPAQGQILVLTTASDTVVSNRATAEVVSSWRQAGVQAESYEFPADLQIPHNAVDPAADRTVKQRVYARMLEMLGEAPER